MGQLLLYEAPLGPLAKWGPGQIAPVPPPPPPVGGPVPTTYSLYCVKSYMDLL